LAYRRLVSEPLIAAVPESWLAEKRLAPQAGKLPAADVIASPLVIFPKRSAPAFYDLVMDYHAAHGGQARIAQEAIQMQTIVNLVSAGLGLAWVPDSVQQFRRPGVTYRQVGGKPAQQVPGCETSLVWPAGTRQPTLERFVEFARRQLRAAPVRG